MPPPLHKNPKFAFSVLSTAVLAVFAAPSLGADFTSADSSVHVGTFEYSYVAVESQPEQQWNEDVKIHDIQVETSRYGSSSDKKYGLIGYYQNNSSSATINGLLSVENLYLYNDFPQDKIGDVAGVFVDSGSLAVTGGIVVNGFKHEILYNNVSSGNSDIEAVVKGIALSNMTLTSAPKLEVSELETNAVANGDSVVAGIDLSNITAQGLTSFYVDSVTNTNPEASNGRYDIASADTFGLRIADSSFDQKLSATVNNVSTGFGHIAGVDITDTKGKLEFSKISVDGLNQTMHDGNSGSKFDAFGLHVNLGSSQEKETSVSVDVLTVKNITSSGAYGGTDLAAVMVGSSLGITDTVPSNTGTASLVADSIEVDTVTVSGTSDKGDDITGITIGRKATLQANSASVKNITVTSATYGGNEDIAGLNLIGGKATLGSLTVDGMVFESEYGGSMDGVFADSGEFHADQLTVQNMKQTGNSSSSVAAFRSAGGTKTTIGSLKISQLSAESPDYLSGVVISEGTFEVTGSAYIDAGQGTALAMWDTDADAEMRFGGTSLYAKGSTETAGKIVVDAVEAYLEGEVKVHDGGSFIASAGGNSSRLRIVNLYAEENPPQWESFPEDLGYPPGYGYWKGLSNADIDGLVAGTGNLQITVTGSEDIGLVDIDRSAIVRTQSSDEYKGVISAQTDVVVAGAAIKSNAGGDVRLDNETSRYEIYGDVIAGSGSSQLSDPSFEEAWEEYYKPNGVQLVGGQVSLGGQNLKVVGDVYAANGGKVSMNLTGSAYFEGRADDYHELNDKLAGEVFHNATFVTPMNPYNKEGALILTAGSIDIKMADESQWLVRGQSFINSLAFAEGFTGKVDLSKDENSSLSIGTLSGSGNFVMRLNADPSKSDMLYVRTLENGANYTITMPETVTRDVASFEDLHGLRIATSNSGEASFKVQMKDMGVRNLTLDVVSEKYDENDPDNVRYNGEGNGEGVWKPGNDVVTEVYGDNGKNWIIDVTSAQEQIKNEAAEQTLSDAAQALIGTARGTYWNAIEIDRFSNRAGDMRYVSGTEGAWVRVRHSRFGTDSGVGNFRSEGMTYQVGYDHAFITNGGRQIVGAAFDYLDNDVDYRSLSGNGNVDRYGLTVYSTWLGDNGGYVDIVGRYGVLDNDFTITNGSGRVVKAAYQNHILGLSAEVGHKLTNDSTGWFLEPSVQLQYVRVTEADYATNQGTMVDQEGIDSVISRAGFRFGKMFEGNKSGSVYAKADWFREYQGEQTLNFKDITTSRAGDAISIDNKGNWFDVGFGAQIGLGDNAFGFADVEYRFGNDLERTWIFNIGGRLTF